MGLNHHALINAVFSQNPTFDTTQSGLLYKIFSTRMGRPARKGDYLKYHFVQGADDSLLPSPYRTMPAYIRVDSPGVKYSPTEIFTLLRKGDSAIVVLPVETIRRHFGDQLPAFLRKKHQLFFKTPRCFY